MKKLMLTTGLIVLAVAAMPYVVGQVSQSNIDQKINELNEQSAYGEFKVLKRENGYRKSFMQYQWAPVARVEKLFDSKTLTIDCHNTHNLLSLDYACNISNYGAFETELRTAFQDSKPITLEGNVSLSNDYEAQINVAPFKVTLKKNTEVSTDGGFIKLLGSGSGENTLSVTGEMTPVMAKDENGNRFTVESSTMTAEGSLYENAFFIGKSAVNLGNISFDKNAGEPLSVNGLQVLSNSNVVNGKFSANGGYKAASLTIPSALNKLTRQPIQLKDLQLTFDFDNAPIDALVALRTAYNDAYKTSLSSNKPQPPAIDESLFKDQLSQLLTKGLSADMLLTATLEGEALNLAVHSELSENMSQEAIDDTSGFRAHLLSSLDIDASANIPNSFLKQAPQLGFMAKSTGQFIQEKTGLSAVASLKDGKLTINGKPSPLRLK